MDEILFAARELLFPDGNIARCDNWPDNRCVLEIWWTRRKTNCSFARRRPVCSLTFRKRRYIETEWRYRFIFHASLLGHYLSVFSLIK